MNLHNKKARISVAALGVTALIAGAGSLFSPASAVGQDLSFVLPATSANIVAASPITALGGLTYGLKLSGDSGSPAMRVENLTGPGPITVLHAVANGVSGYTATLAATTTVSTTVQLPTTGIVVGDTIVFGTGTPETKTVASITDGTHIVVDSATNVTHLSGDAVSITAPAVTAAVGVSTLIPSYTAGDRLYLGAPTAGTYTLRFFEDGNGDGNYQAGSDDTTPTFTLTVKDPLVAGTFDLSTPTSLDAGTTKAKTTVATTLTTTDIRGTSGSPAVGTLGLNIAAQLTHDFTNGAQVTNGPPDAASLFDGTNFYQWMSSTSGADAIGRSGIVSNTIGTQLKWLGGADFPTTAKVTTITTNGVTNLGLAVLAGQTANVTGTGTSVLVRAGKDTVTYTATATDGTNGLPSKTVVFTFDPTSFVGTALTDLTANGAAIPSTGDSTNKVSVTTDASGVATLVVKTTKTAATAAYKFTASSGSGVVVGGPILATYTSAAATTFTTSGGTAQTVGGSVTLTGKVLDQWLVGLNTGGQATLTVTRGGGIGSNITRGVDVQSDGTFSSVVADATANTTVHNDTYTWSGLGSATGPSSENIYWVASLNVAAAALTGLGANTTFPVPATFTPTLATHTAMNPINITGTLKDGTAAAVPYAPFTLTGTPGIKFLSSSGVLTSTFTGTANAAGLLSDGTNPYVRVMFTIDGDNSITVKSGATATATTGIFDTTVPVDAWKISANDAASSPGATIIVTGKITDFFGNGVPAYEGLLDLGSSTIGALGNADPATNSQGVFSTTFVSGSNSSGVATLTATLPTTAFGLTPMTTDPLVGVAYATTGTMFDTHGEYTDAAKITVKSIPLTLSATAALTAGYAGGNAELSGTFMPSTSVDIYAKQSGDLSYTLVDSVSTDATGAWETSILIKKSTYFLAKSSGLSSASAQTVVNSRVSLTAKALGRDKVLLTANGDPNATATLSFYKSVAGTDPKIASKTSNSAGYGQVVVTLPKGSRVVYVKYDAPGTGTGTSAMVRVTVK